MSVSGYSGTPLYKKLGIKEGYVILPLNAPSNYLELLGQLPPNVAFARPAEKEVDLIHYFETSKSIFEEKVLSVKGALKGNGMLWVSWPKGSASLATDLNRDLIRDYLLKTELVDTKVCSVDDTWSGLKFVIRKELR